MMIFAIEVSPSLVASLCAVLIAVIPAYLSFRASDRSNRRTEVLQAAKVDREALNMAIGIYDGIIGELQKEVRRLRENLQEERSRLRRAESRIITLQRWAGEHGLTVPPEDVDNGDASDNA